MDFVLCFKDIYSDKEMLLCAREKEKLFSNVPMGVGARPLYAYEVIGIMDCLDEVEEEEMHDQIRVDLVSIHRNGNHKAVHPQNRGRISVLYERFIELSRLRMIDAVGLPILFDIEEGKSVFSIADVFQWADQVEEIVKATHTAYSQSVTQEARAQVMVEFAKKAVVLPELMFVQAVLYYDMQTDFVVDFDRGVMAEGILNWHPGVFSSRDEVLQFRSEYYAFKYLDYRDFFPYRFSSKYHYEIFRHKVRLGESFLMKKAVRLKKISRVHVFCNVHDRFFCLHEENRGLMVNAQDVIGSNDFKYMRGFVDKLSTSAWLLLRRVIQNRSPYESLAIVVAYAFRSKKDDPIMLAIVSRLRSLIVMGLVMVKLSASNVVKSRISDLFRGSARNFVAQMSKYDLRTSGYDKTVREQGDGVDYALGRYIMMDNLEVNFNDRLEAGCLPYDNKAFSPLYVAFQKREQQHLEVCNSFPASRRRGRFRRKNGKKNF